MDQALNVKHNYSSITLYTLKQLQTNVKVRIYSSHLVSLYSDS